MQTGSDRIANSTEWIFSISKRMKPTDVSSPWTATGELINSSEWITSSYEWTTSVMEQWTSSGANPSEMIGSRTDRWINSTGEWINSTAEPGGSSPREFPPPPLYLFIIKFVVCAVFLFVSFFGNLIVCYAVATTRKLRSYNNYYLIGLAVADLISGGVVPSMLNIIWLVDYWPFSEALCTVLMFADHVFLHVTFLMTLIICIDRYRALYLPVKHMKEKTLRHACWMISIGYVVPLLIWTPLIVVLPYAGVMERIYPPLCSPPYGNYPGLLILSPLALSWIPILATTVLYARIYFAIIRRTRGHEQKMDRPKETLPIESRSGVNEKPNRKNKRESALNSPFESSPAILIPYAEASLTAPSTDTKKTFSVSLANVNLAFDEDNEKENGFKPRTGQGESTSKTASKLQSSSTSTGTDINTIAHVSMRNVNLASKEKEEKGSNSGEPRSKQGEPSTNAPEFQSPSVSPRNHRISIAPVLRKINMASEEEEDNEDMICKPQTRHGEPVGESDSSKTAPNRRPRPVNPVGRKASLVSLRATRTLTYIWVVMVVSGMPWSVYALIGAVAQEHTPYTDTGLLSFLAHLSSAANPFCYAICNPLFRRAFRHMLSCRPCRRSRGSTRADGQEMKRRQRVKSPSNS